MMGHNLMSVTTKKLLPTALMSATALFTWGLFVYSWQVIQSIPEPLNVIKVDSRALAYVDNSGNNRYIPDELPAIQSYISRDVVEVSAESPKVFAYAHATVMVGDKIFIGMADKMGNPFPTNRLTIFDANDLGKPSFINIATSSESTESIQTMVYDHLNDKIYFLLTSESSMNVYSLNPHTFGLSMLFSSTTMGVGRRPAIVTDGVYIYGITDTESSTVFRIKVNGTEFKMNSSGHIPKGHAAAIGVYASSTELYFSGGMSNGFEKTDPITLDVISSIKIEPCGMSDDMAFAKIATSSGYVYIGCENVAYGIRMKTDDLSYERFSLPGSSFGLFIYGNDLYNAAQDDNIDIFPGRDLNTLYRYRILDGPDLLTDDKGQVIALNELLFSPKSNKIFFTAWWGTGGLYQVSTSTMGTNR